MSVCVYIMSGVRFFAAISFDRRRRRWRGSDCVGELDELELTLGGSRALDPNGTCG